MTDKVKEVFRSFAEEKEKVRDRRRVEGMKKKENTGGDKVRESKLRSLSINRGCQVKIFCHG